MHSDALGRRCLGSDIWREVKMKVRDDKVWVQHPSLLPPLQKEGELPCRSFLGCGMALLEISDFTVVRKGSTM